MEPSASPTTIRKAFLFSPSNRWIYSNNDGFDLTQTDDVTNLKINSTTLPITISPQKSALVIIDMQNFFLSPYFGRDAASAGHRACQNLIDYAIPAARKAGIQIIWLNWGLTEQEFKDMPPAIKRAFGFLTVLTGGNMGGQNEVVCVDRFGEERPHRGQSLVGGEPKGAFNRGMGCPCGEIKLEDGRTVDAGRLLMRDTWNAALYPPLDTIFEEGKLLTNKSDVWIHKNRMSGMWGAKTQLEEFLEKENIQTLMFAGVNTDQCVGGTLTDAFSKGYDCILLKDGSGTTSPEFAQQCFEFNTARSYGFCVTCQELSEAVQRMTS